MADKKKKVETEQVETEKVETKKVEAKKETPKKVDVNAFIARKLKVINELESEASKKFLAQRVLNNKRGK